MNTGEFHPYPPEYFRGDGNITLGAHHREFVTANAGHHIAFTYSRPNSMRGETDPFVAGSMAPGLVYQLQLIEIHRNHAGGMAIAAAANLFRSQQAVPAAAIIQPGH